MMGDSVANLVDTMAWSAKRETRKKRGCRWLDLTRNSNAVWMARTIKTNRQR